MSNENPSVKLPPGSWKTIAVVMFAPFMTQLDSTIVNVSLASIQTDLRAPIASAQWIITAYLLALALMLPLHGWLVERVGAKKLYLICFSIFTLSSLLCALARNMPELIGARILQGMAGGILAPLAQLVIVRTAGRQATRVVGYAVVPVLLAPLIGPMLAGVILKFTSWRWLFLVNLPVGILAVALALRFISKDESTAQRHSFDIWGFLSLSPGLAFALYGFERVLHEEGWTFLAAGFVLLGIFIFRTRDKQEGALIDLGLFRIRTFRNAALTQFLTNGIMYSGQFLIPLYLMTGVGLNPDQAGWILSTMCIGMLMVFPMMGKITDRCGCRLVVVGGTFINIIGTLPFLWMTQFGFSTVIAIIGLFLRGLGQGATSIPSISAAYNSVPKVKLSSATTALNIVQRLGGPVITTVIAMTVSLSEQNSLTDNSHAFTAPFVILMAVQILILPAALKLPIRVSNAPQETRPQKTGNIAR